MRTSARPRLATRATLAVPGLAVLAPLALLGACGEEATASSEVVTIEITVEGDEISPAGERVEVDPGQPVDLIVTADAPGEIHLHSTPEQYLEYDAGTTTLEIAVSEPGIVEVESHDTGDLIVQLEVS